jgi:hypothetical protein
MATRKKALDVPALRREAKRIRDEEKPDLAATKDRIEDAPDAEAFVVATLVFMRHKGKLGPEDWRDVARWAQSVETPESADLFARYVAGPLYAKEPEEALVARWAGNAEPLMRRLALRVAGMTVADVLAGDEDALVQEALVDVLRGEDEEDVYAFVVAHEEMPDALVRSAAALLTPKHALQLTMRRRGEGSPPRGRRPSRRRRGA